MTEEKRSESLIRFEKLANAIEPYLKEKEVLKKETGDRTKFLDCKQKILKHFQVGEEEWNSWKWQLTHRITDPEEFSLLLNVDSSQKEEMKKVVLYQRMAVSPFLLANLYSYGSALSKQFLPALAEIELADQGEMDPMAEEFTSPIPGITRRYPDRVILNVTNICGSYCRFCQRRRNLGTVDKKLPLAELDAAINYIKDNPEIRDVLVTGGDPLTLSDKDLAYILQSLRHISSVEVIRIGTRMPVVIPQRVTPELLDIIKESAPIYINLHVNHPTEVTPEFQEACRNLLFSGAILGSQTVLMRDINDSSHTLRFMFQALLKVGVKPYYLFHAKSVSGTAHFRTTVSEGVKLIESMRGFTSGLAIPNFVVNMPGGLGKVAILPQSYLGNLDNNPILFKTWEQQMVAYPNEVGREQND